MALMALGPVVFTLVTNVQETSTSAESTFAKHAVVGTPPIYEAMGMGETATTLKGVVHPHVTGVDGSLAALETACARQIPLPLMRGDFLPLGWHVITKFERSDKTFEAYGRGLEIEFTVTLAKVDGVGAVGPLDILQLFASTL